MEIIKAQEIGYCKGVEDAIKKVYDTIKQFPNTKIYLFGQIVHNDYVNKKLSDLGVIILNDLSIASIKNIKEGIIIFSAHGISDEIISAASHLHVINTICPFVSKNMKLMKLFLDKGYEIIYVGVKNHPEAVAALSISPKIHLIENSYDLNSLTITKEKIMLTNQTTISYNDLKILHEEAKRKYPDIYITNEICFATRIRQDLINKIQDDIDGIIIVGDKKSNNTTNLYKLALKNHNDAIMVDSFSSIAAKWLIGKKRIAVFSGTSTPSEIVDDIILNLEKC